jgi:phosphopantetheinyl transferase (holo-ACP synthase)
VVKALALEVWNPHDVEVVREGDGAPSVRLAGTVAARASELGGTVAISLTHTRGMAGAVAVVGP